MMKYYSTIYVMHAFMYAIALSVCNIHADGPKQPEFKPNLNEPKTFRTGNFKFPENDPQNQPKSRRNINKQDIPKEVSPKIVEDIMREYPEVAERVELLRDEDTDTVFIPKTLLLAGKPGCSKTTIAIAIAQTLNRKSAFFEATALVGDAYQNSGVQYLEEKLGKIIEDIKQNPDVKYVVIIDEIMRLAEKYSHDRGEGKDIATKLWFIMDQFKQSDRVFLIATANEIDDLPEPIKSRFSKQNIIEINPPKADYRKKILLNCLKNMHDLTENELQNLVTYTEGLTHREIETVVENGAFISARTSGKKKVISYKSLEEAISEIKNISFIGRWVYDPVNNWIVNPTNNWVIKPCNNFCKKNKETLATVQTGLTIGLAITGIAAAVYSKYQSANTTAPIADPAIASALQTIQAAWAAHATTNAAIAITATAATAGLASNVKFA